LSFLFGKESSGVLFSSNRLRGEDKILRIPSAKNGPGNVNSFELCPEKTEMKAGKQINREIGLPKVRVTC
jgi:hypothetical protein